MIELLPKRLLLLIVVGQSLCGIQNALGLPRNDLFLALYAVTAFCLGADWWLSDRRRLGLWGGLDAALVFAYVWPIALPYHLIQHHRLRGLFTLIVLGAAYVVPYSLVTAVLYYLVVRSG